jgi:hypothetical protein
MARRLPAARIPPVRTGRRQGKQALLFVNKKKQKNFINLSSGLVQHRAKRSKSFLVLFFKKELLASPINPP